MKHFFLPVVFALLLLGAGCGSRPTTQAPPLSPPANMGYPEDQNPVRARPHREVCDTKNFICVDRSRVGSHLPINFNVTGTAIAFESTMQWKLENASGTVLGQGTLMTAASDIGQPGLFTLTTNRPITPGTATGALSFFEFSAMDGSSVHLLALPVSF